jgi:hypothetical protein
MTSDDIGVFDWRSRRLSTSLKLFVPSPSARPSEGGEHATRPSEINLFQIVKQERRGDNTLLRTPRVLLGHDAADQSQRSTTCLLLTLRPLDRPPSRRLSATDVTTAAPTYSASRRRPLRLQEARRRSLSPPSPKPARALDVLSRTSSASPAFGLTAEKDGRAHVFLSELRIVAIEF